jgi:hypothetical protein
LPAPLSRQTTRRDVAQPLAQGVDVGRQVGRAALLAGLDQADAARVRQALRLQRLERADRRVDRITVVGAAAAVEQAVLVLGRPGPEAVAPAAELGLLVEVAVQQHGVGLRRAGGRQFEEDHRRAAFEADHLELQARQACRPSTQVAASRTTRSIRPWAAQSASNIGLLAGTAM